MEQLILDVNWIAVVIGAIVSFAFGALWYSPILFATKWLQGVGIPEDDNGSVIAPMITQAVGTFLMAWIIGIIAVTNSISLAILITITIAVIVIANGLFVRKSSYAIATESGFIVAMGVIMVATHVIL